jgi:hypothetical protein
MMPSSKKQTSKGVPSPPPGLPSVQDRISQLKFAARLQTSHEMRGGQGISVLPPMDRGVGDDDSTNTKKSKNKSLFKPRFLSKSA